MCEVESSKDILCRLPANVLGEHVFGSFAATITKDVSTPPNSEEFAQKEQKMNLGSSLKVLFSTTKHFHISSFILSCKKQNTFLCMIRSEQKWVHSMLLFFMSSFNNTVLLCCIKISKAPQCKKKEFETVDPF